METPLHIIDVTTIDGLMDMIALGNIIEFAVALDMRTYNPTIVLDTVERHEQEAAMAHYRTLVRWFGRNYGLLIDDSWVNGTYIFKRRLISFAASVGAYFDHQHSITQRQDPLKGITLAKVKQLLRRNIELNWTDLLPGFDSLTPSHFLYHISHPFCLIRKTPLNLLKEKLMDCREDRQYAGAPIYLSVSAAPPPVPDHPGEKRVHNPASPVTSLSQKKVAKRRKDGGEM
jgi:hypothetical protein